MLLIVFIAAYGVGSQAIINPYRQFNWDWESFDELLKGIFFLPYWQMYGELNLESVEVRDPDPENGCSNFTTASLTNNVSFIETCSAPDLYNIKESKTVNIFFKSKDHKKIMYKVLCTVCLLIIICRYPWYSWLFTF